MAEFDRLLARLAQVQPIRRTGTVTAISAGTVTVAGLPAAVGDRVRLSSALEGEVMALHPGAAVVMPDSMPDGLGTGAVVDLIGPARIAPDAGWIGRVVDPFGNPLDGRALLPGAVPRALRATPPPPATRRRLGARLETGTAVFDTLLPLVRGQRIGLFAGSGVGKSSLLARLARGVQADVVVIALIGERGREVKDFTDDVLGPDGMARSVVVAATSDQPPVVRRRCAWAAMAVAEHFRDMGLHVLFLADSVTRFAEAHREVALAGGEVAALRGHPPSVAHAIMSLAERAGPGAEGTGDITAVFSVLVAGSDMDEPVADILRGVLDGHVVMDRRIAERGRYPAIDLLKSVSRSLPGAANDGENALIGQTRRVLAAWDRAELMVQAGLYARGSDPAVDEAIRLFPRLDAFLAEPAPEGGVSASFARLSQLLRG